MFKRNYYCLVAGLPDLFFDDHREIISSIAFSDYLKSELSDPDFELVKYLYLPYDNANLISLAFNLNKPFDTSAMYSRAFLEEQLNSPDSLPDYMKTYLNHIYSTGQKDFTVQNENKLISLYFEEVLQTKNEFLRNWFLFDLNLRNIVTSLLCFQNESDISKHLIHIKHDPNINSLLSSALLKPELLEDDVPFVYQIFRIIQSDNVALEKEKSIDKLKWQYLDEHTFFHFFTIEKIISFVIKLQIIERWKKLDKKSGQDFLNQFTNELIQSYGFPSEYAHLKTNRSIENEEDQLKFKGTTILQ